MHPNAFTSIVLSALLAFPSLAFAQSAPISKKPLDHSVYDSWKSTGAIAVTHNGQYATAQISAQEGDGQLAIINFTKKGSDVHYVERATGARFTPAQAYAVFTIKPFFAQTQEAKDKKKDAPKDTLGIWNLATGTLTRYPNLKSFAVSKEGPGNVIAFLVDRAENPDKAANTDGTDRENRTPGVPSGGNPTGAPTPGAAANAPAPRTPSGPAGGSPRNRSGKASDLIVCDPVAQTLDTLYSVSLYAFSKNGDGLALVCAQDTLHHIEAGAYLYHIGTRHLQPLLTGGPKEHFYLPTLSDDLQRAAFIMNPDTTADAVAQTRLYYYSATQSIRPAFTDTVPRQGVAVCIAGPQSQGLPEGWFISHNQTVTLNDNPKQLFLGTAPLPPVRDTSIAIEKRAKLDIWHYNDEYLQPAQLKQLAQTQRRSYMAFMDPTHPNVLTQVGSDSMQVFFANARDAQWAYGYNDKPYRKASQWDSDTQYDLYFIPEIGSTPQLLQRGARIGNISVSPNGSRLIYFDKEQQEWFSFDPKTGKVQCLSMHVGVSFWNQEQDTPSRPSAYGAGGWTADESGVFIYDRYDIWLFDPTGAKEPTNITNGYGRAHEITFRITRPDQEARGFGGGSMGLNLNPQEGFAPKATLYLSAYNNVTKENGFFTHVLGSKKDPVLLTLDGHTYTNVVKAKKANLFVYSRNNFEESPNIWYTKQAFATQQCLTDINPQQNDYNWGTAHLVHWNATDGRPCDGILYKPADFDPSKKYPMLIYFYERLSNGLFTYKMPSPSRSSINISFFVSNGYLVFTPDIYYETGHPGQSAMNCIMPGIDMLCQNPWVDEANMAIQGQSWGGYQVAYMITQTNRFKAAWAGAPVSNMTSAYSGIRWGSGVARNMQYEGGQSRIGTNLWDGFDLYVENSPLFFAQNVETPLVIMHNDNDGAVPWYQGIEYFVGLRRLGKQVWMLQYNGEEHNLAQRVNAKDISIRLEQFFDHFLKGKKAAPWIETGLPAYKKGYDWGL